MSISKNLDKDHISEQYDKLSYYLNENIYIIRIEHDELINIFNLISNFNINYQFINDKHISKQNSLRLNSYLYIKYNNILNISNISVETKQLLLEEFILSYEKEFSLNII